MMATGKKVVQVYICVSFRENEKWLYINYKKL